MNDNRTMLARFDSGDRSPAVIATLDALGWIERDPHTKGQFRISELGLYFLPYMTNAS